MPAKLSSLPEYMTAAQVAEWREVTRQCVGQWKRAGKINAHHQAPNSRSAMYCTDALLRALGPMPDDPPEWYEPAPDSDDDDEGEANYTKEHAKLERAKRKKAELDLAKLAGSLVDAGEARTLWATVGVATRQRVLGIIPRVAPRLAAMDTAHEVTQLLEEVLRAALTMTEADVMGGK